MITQVYLIKYFVLWIFVVFVWLLYTSLFLYSSFDWERWKNLWDLFQNAIEWNRQNLEVLWMYFLARSPSSPKLDISFCVYLLSYAGFVAYTSQWLMKKIETDERKPHPFFIHGKLVKDSITCNPSDESFETIDPEIHTLTDIRNRFSRFGSKEAIYNRKQWLSYSDVLRLSEVIADIVKSYSTTSAPLAIIGDFSSIKCCTILGLASIGRSTVFIPQDEELTTVSRILEEQHCEVLLTKHSRLMKLEDVLNVGLCRDLRVVLYTDEDLIEKSDVGGNVRAEETLIQEYGLELVSLSHEMYSYHNYEIHERLEATEQLRDTPALIVYNNDMEPIALTHRNIVAAASALVQEYGMK